MPKISIVIPARLCNSDIRYRVGGDRAALEERETAALARAMQATLQATAIINANWVLDQWDDGKKPKCCARCNGTKYAPDDVGAEMTILTSPDLFAAGVGSCGSIAACHTGHKIAESFTGKWFDGSTSTPLPWEEACSRYRVVMRKGIDPAKPRLLHAACMDDGEFVEATSQMARKSR